MLEISANIKFRFQRRQSREDFNILESELFYSNIGIGRALFGTVTTAQNHSKTFICCVTILDQLETVLKHVVVFVFCSNTANKISFEMNVKMKACNK